MELITPYVWIGSIHAAKDVQRLTRNHVTQVISVLNETLPQKTRRLYEANGIAHTAFFATDDALQNLSDIAERARVLIRTHQGITLVHCHTGISRSVSVVVYFLMKENGLSYDDAMEAVKIARPSANPNNSFRAWLMSQK
jgi:protein-tyrosine phosphatase